MQVSPVALAACLLLAGAIRVAQAAQKPDLSEELIGNILRTYNTDRKDLDRIIQYIHPPVKEPIRDGVSLAVPPELGNPKLARLGYVDVTAAPFGADPSGKRDSTEAIQKAVEFASWRQMACFFPAGTYLVRDTIRCIEGPVATESGNLKGTRSFPNVLVGSAAGPARRAVLLLAPSSPGFNDPRSPKVIVLYRSIGARLGGRNTGGYQDNISYNNTFANIDIKIGEHNPGAVGILLRGAEGSSVQDVTIDATHGLAGMAGASGSGGSQHHVTVIGGKIGVDTRALASAGGEEDAGGVGTQPTPTLTAFTLIGQTQASLVVASRGPLIAVGCRIVRKSGAAIVVCKDSQLNPFNSSLCLIDSQIEYETESPDNVAIQAGRSYNLFNVYVRNAARVSAEAAGQPQRWLRIKEMSVSKDPGKYEGVALSEPVYIEGAKVASPHVELGGSDEPPADLQSRHIWGSDFPTFETPGAANVKDAPYNAVGDSHADDTAAIQRAIDEHEIIFLPKGYYRLTDTLRLRPNTKIIGVGQVYSAFVVRDPNPKSGKAGAPAPMLLTATDPSAKTYLAFVGFYLTNVAPPSYKSDSVAWYALRWQCGRASICRSLFYEYGNYSGLAEGKALAVVNPMVQVTGAGGGKFYNFYRHGFIKYSGDYRHLLIADKKGEPLSFYHCHAQHSSRPEQVEIRNSSDVTFYGVKTENDTSFMLVTNCDHIRVFGHGGNARPRKDYAHYVFQNTKDLLITNIADEPFFSGAGEGKPAATRARKAGEKSKNARPSIQEYNAFWDGPFKAPSNERPIMYRKGNPF